MRASRFLQQLALACAVISLAALAAHGAVVEYDWTVDYSTQAPDCVPKLTIAINGQYPGPEIRVTAGDTVVVKLKNLIPTEDVVIHWHGILQDVCGHLHGHDFWVLGFGEGVFDPSKDYAKLNYYNPPLMNTAPVFKHGWTVLRFVADNPGAWAFHCHVEAHFHMGMGVVFAEGIDQIPEIPKQNLGCGFTKNFLPGN